MKPALSAVWLLAVSSGWILCHPVPAQAEPLDSHLVQSATQGKQLFTHETFGGNGKVCESCHLAGGTTAGRRPDGDPMPSLTNAAVIFPRFNLRQEKVMTLQDQIRSCVANALQGAAPAEGSPELAALGVYLATLAQGKPLDPGGQPR